MVNFKKLFIVVLLLVFVVSIQGRISVNASVNLAKWDLVDSGKHLDWDGNTNFMVQFQAAVKKWNAHKPGVIRKDSWKIVEDVSISDYFSEDSTAAKVLTSGKIKFNQYYMDYYSDETKTNVCLGAIGIALGLGLTSNSRDVMYKSANRITDLSKNDKDSYNAAYKKY